MNYRIDLSHETVMKDVKTGNITHLLSQDQLVKELQVNPRFSLQLFKEAPITFLPTYKYDQGSDTYDTSEKQRIPAWCDRILWRSFTPEYTHNLHYQRYEVDVSDHRPISGGFEVVVKSIDSEAQASIKDRIQQEWTQEEQNIIDKAKLFYTSYY